MVFFWFTRLGEASTFFALGGIYMSSNEGTGWGGRPGRVVGAPNLLVPRAVDGTGGCLGLPRTPPSPSAFRFAPEICGCVTNGRVATAGRGFFAMLNCSAFAFTAPAPGGGGGGCEEDEAATLTGCCFLDLVFAIAAGLNGVSLAKSGFLGLAAAMGAAAARDGFLSGMVGRSPRRGERSLLVCGSASAIVRMISRYTSPPLLVGAAGTAAVGTDAAAIGGGGVTIGIGATVGAGGGATRIRTWRSRGWWPSFIPFKVRVDPTNAAGDPPET